MSIETRTFEITAEKEFLDNLEKMFSDFKCKHKKLLTTEDGVEIYDTTTIVWGVDTKKWNTFCWHAIFAKNGKYTGLLFFSNPSSRETYMIQNAPLLCLNDIREVNEISELYIRIRKLEKLAEERLKEKT